MRATDQIDQIFVMTLLLFAGCGAPADPAHPDAALGAGDGLGLIDARVPVDDACFPHPAAGHSSYTCDGHAFDVEVPAQCLTGGCGIILDVHGLTMSGPMEDANTELRMRGSAAGFVVIQPSATPAPPQASWSADDEPKVFDILTRAIAVYAIDPDRVHMTGFSQGGFMTWRFVCAHADVLASVAPAAAASNCASAGGAGPVQAACSFTGAEMPSRKLSILYMHGRADENYIPFSCAQPQVDAIASAWGLHADGVVASGAGYTRTRWRDAAIDVEVELLAHDYTSTAQVPFVSASELQGHCFPGSNDPGNQPGQLFSFRCEQPAAFTWGDEVVKFFLAHER